jgi:TetR/AcrR family transcriptional regulator
LKAPTKTLPDASIRQKLLASATELFNRKGYAATTVREIVEAAGVTKPVLYYYFGSKEGIYRELLNGPIQEFDRLLVRAGRERAAVREKIVTLCDRLYALSEENLPLLRLMNAIYYGPPQGAPLIDFDSAHFKFQGLVKKLVAEGMRKGEIRKGRADDAMWAVTGALNVAIEVSLCHPEMAIGRKGLARILNTVFDGLEPGRKPGPESRRAGEPGKKR